MYIPRAGIPGQPRVPTTPMPPAPVRMPTRGPMNRPGAIAARPGMPMPPYRSMKKGGKVKKTGIYKLHKGEEVVPLKSLLRARSK